MPDFAVSYAHLEQTENTLNSLKGEFDGVDAVARAADWGDSGIAAAMESFASNWDYHRQKLIESMDAMAKQARETHTGTREWDAKTAQQVAK